MYSTLQVVLHSMIYYLINDILYNPPSFSEALCSVGVLDGWEGVADDLLCSSYHSPQCLAALNRAAAVPHSDAPSQDALDSASVGACEDCRVHPEFLKPSQEGKALVCAAVEEVL